MRDCWGYDANRWHTNQSPALRNSGDTIDSHSNRMAKMALWLWGDDVSRELLAAIVFHDCAESGPGGTGDVPGPSKEGAYLGAILERQWRVEEERGIACLLDALSEEDEARLHFLDRLDAYRWAAAVAPWEMGDDDWPEARASLLHDAERLGVLDKVEAVLK